MRVSACLLATLLVVALASVAVAAPVSAESDLLVEAQLVERLDVALAGETVDFGMETELMEVAAETAPKTTTASPKKSTSSKATAPKTTVPKSTAPKSTAPKTSAPKGKSTTTPKTSSKSKKTPTTKEAPVKVTPSTPDDLAKWAQHKARNRKRYATPEKEAAAFEKFKANRRVIAARNAKAASKLNPKPFSSKGALATKSPQQFKKMLRTKKPARGSGTGKTAQRKTPSRKTSAPKAPAPKASAPKAAKARFVQLRRRVTQLRQSPGGAGGVVTKAGGVASKAGGVASKAGGVASKSGGDAGKAGGVAHKSGGDAGKAGGQSSKSGGDASKSGGTSSKSGGTSSKAGGVSNTSGGRTDRIVAPTEIAGSNALAGFEGSVFFNPADRTPEARLCRVIMTVWMKRFMKDDSDLFGIRTQFQQDPLVICRGAGVAKKGSARMAFETMMAAPAATPFINKIISLDVVPRNQEQCGSCWAQAAVGTYEVALRKAGISSPPLSVQQVVDCAPAAGSKGCDGGTPMQGVTWLSRNFAATEAAYPYTGVEGQCAPAATGPQRAKGWEMAIPGCTEGPCADQWKYEIDLMYKVQTTGPFIAYVDATNWQYYDKGIFPPSECTSHPDNGNHVVELLGYGQENGTPYWIIKNSWGAGWGENGYIRVAMGINSCGIANYVGHAVL